MTIMIQKQPRRRPSANAVYLPLAIRAAGLPCLVVGGGRIGGRKTASLLAAGAKVAVLSPAISPFLAKLVQQGQVEWIQAEYAALFTEGYRLVVAATDDPALNLQIGQDAERRGVFACVVSSAEAPSAIFPAACRYGEVTVAVHSHGRSCRRSQAVRNRIAAWLAAEPEPDGRKAERRRCTRRHLRRRNAKKQGKVYIVGAGPGASDLISLRGWRALRSAEAILVDQLVPATFLAELGISGEGKRICHLGNEQPRWTQETINRWLVDNAQAGRTVARLKGGDPLVFGRGDAEIESLAAAGLPWEIIPGASSATAVATAAGLPLTRHGQGRSFAVATARVEGGKLAASFPQADSLVILMGMAALNEIAVRLTEDGWPPDAPTAIIERGTLTWERHVFGPLCRLSELARQANVASPALIVVGDAARSIAAMRGRPTVLFTGVNPSRFRSLGNLLHWPAQAIAQRRPRRLVPHPELGRPLPGHDAIYFVSPSGIRAYAAAYGCDAFLQEVWCLDRVTQQSLAEYGVEAVIVPPLHAALNLSLGYGIYVKSPGADSSRNAAGIP